LRSRPPFLRDARDIGRLVVGVHTGRPVFLQDVASVHDDAPPAQRYVWHGVTGPHRGEYPATRLSAHTWVRPLTSADSTGRCNTLIAA